MMRKERYGGVRLLFALLVTLVMVFPVYWMFLTSVKSSEEVLGMSAGFFPKSFHPENYLTAWKESNFLRVICNTAVMTLGQMCFQLVIGVLAAYGFARGRFKGRNVLFVVVLSAMMIPEQVTFIPIYVLIAHLDLIDTFKGLILPGIVSPYMIYMLRQNFMAVDQSYMDAAKVDGLGIIGTIYHVLLPMCRPAVITVLLISMINGWNNYFWPKIISKSDSTMVIAVALARMKNMYEGLASDAFYNVIMAGVAISVIPIILVFACNQKSMMKGYAKNAMK